MLEADPNNFAFAFDDLKRIELKKDFGAGGRSYLVIHPIKGSRKALYFGREYRPEVQKVLQDVAARVFRP